MGDRQPRQRHVSRGLSHADQWHGIGASAYREAAELPDPKLLVWAIGGALMQVEGVLCLAVDPCVPGAKGWRSAKARNKDIEACEVLSERLRELIEMLERVRPTVE